MKEKENKDYPAKETGGCLWIVLVFIIICFFYSCDQQVVKDNIVKRKAFENSININWYHIIIIEYDSCEYLISGSGSSQMMTHKGNCKYCTKRQK